jgi:hypothetical protein
MRRNPIKYAMVQRCENGNSTELVFVNLLRSPGIDFPPGGPVRQPYFSYRAANRLAESIPAFPGLLKLLQIRVQLCL